MAKRILRTAFFTCLGIGICIIGGMLVAILALADPMPTGIKIENRSKDIISASIHVNTSRRELQKEEIILQGESCSVSLDVRDKNVRYAIDIVRSKSKGKKNSFHFDWEGGNQDERLVFTDANKLEEHKWGENLPLVIK